MLSRRAMDIGAAIIRKVLRLFAVMKLDEYECGMLDALLEAFGVPDMLTRHQILALFDGDEETAFRMVQILLREGLVAERGAHGDYDLPEKLILRAKGDKLLRSGGFTGLYHRQTEPQPEVIGGTLSNLQQENLQLRHAQVLREREMDRLRRQLLIFQVLSALMLMIAAWFCAHYFKLL